jgi:hypothetical protein
MAASQKNAGQIFEIIQDYQNWEKYAVSSLNKR